MGDAGGTAVTVGVTTAGVLGVVAVVAGVLEGVLTVGVGVLGAGGVGVAAAGVLGAGVLEGAGGVAVVGLGAVGVVAGVLEAAGAVATVGLELGAGVAVGVLEGVTGGFTGAVTNADVGMPGVFGRASTLMPPVALEILKPNQPRIFTGTQTCPSAATGSRKLGKGKPLSTQPPGRAYSSVKVPRVSVKPLLVSVTVTPKRGNATNEMRSSSMVKLGLLESASRSRRVSTAGTIGLPAIFTGAARLEPKSSIRARV